MEEQFYTILTKLGKSKVANATGLGEKVNLTKFKVGDSNGNYYNPTEEQTDLRNVVYETNINAVYTDEDNSNWIVIEVVIPGNIGGFTIREAAAFDDLGNMIAIGKYPETYKPLSENGSTKDLLIKMILEVSNASVVTIKVDPTVIFASKKDLEVLENKIKKTTGDKNELITKDKSNIVNAINEVATGLNTIELTAEKITIKDENNNFESDTVEGALLENKTSISEQGKQIESLKQSGVSAKSGMKNAINSKVTIPDVTDDDNWQTYIQRVSDIKEGRGNAQTTDVLVGKTFTNDSGQMLTGNMQPGKKWASGEFDIPVITGMSETRDFNVTNLNFRPSFLKIEYNLDEIESDIIDAHVCTYTPKLLHNSNRNIGGSLRHYYYNSNEDLQNNSFYGQIDDNVITNNGFNFQIKNFRNHRSGLKLKWIAYE